MNLGEYGNYLRINLGENVTGLVNTMELFAPNSETGRVIRASDGLFIGNSDMLINGQNYRTGEYIVYQIKEGDIYELGMWRVLAKSEGGGARKITCKGSFSVTGC